MTYRDGRLEKRVKARVYTKEARKNVCNVIYPDRENCTGEGEKFIMFEQGVDPPS